MASGRFSGDILAKGAMTVVEIRWRASVSSNDRPEEGIGPIEAGTAKIFYRRSIPRYREICISIVSPLQRDRFLSALHGGEGRAIPPYF